MNLPAGHPGGIDPPLEKLSALALDCQTTGASAERDHVFEIGWRRIDPTADRRSGAAGTCLVALPEGVELPPRIARLTGVRVSEFEAALEPEAAWQRLLMAAKGLPVPAGAVGGLLMIHYARFEVPFLEGLHARCGSDGDLPFQVVCTHAIARRLLPHLPRCGLRALAGYFGVALGEHKRAADHAAATRGIWEHLVPLLAAEGIRRWSQLSDWLGRPPVSGRVARTYPMPHTLRRETPDAPGVYRMRRGNGDLLYVGKARSLRRRINSYFQSGRRHPEHILEMLTQARRLDYTPTPTALEAALMEADLIKAAAPPYNIALKPREVAPVFFAEDFQTAGTPDCPGFPVGPLPSERSLAAFRFVVSWCGRSEPTLPRREAILAANFDLPAAYLPPRAVLEEGLNTYREICAGPGDLTLTGRLLLKRGLVLWREHLAARPEGEDDLDGGGEDDDLNAWSVPAVVALLDSIVRRGSQLVRRGRWLRILANASLCWETAEQRSPTARILHIREGRIDSVPHDAAGRTASHSRPPAARTVFTSAATYDRLRVLTTELRRLVGEERQVRILPAVGGPIERQGLARLLNVI